MAEARTETITVRDGEPRQIETLLLPGVGAVLPDDLAPVPVTSDGRRMLLRWTGFAPTREAQAFIDFNRAADLDDIEAAIDRMEIGNFNFIAAVHDEITYRVGARVPSRPWASDAKPPFTLLDGDDVGTTWSDQTLRGEQLPTDRNPARGWLASANNDPYGFTADGSLDGDAFYYGVFFDPGTRAARIESELERLVARGGITVADVQDLQLDSHSVLADLLLPLLETHWVAGEQPELDALVTSMLSWDRRMNRDSAAALVFHIFMSFAVKRTIRDDLSLAFDAIADSSNITVIKMGLMTLAERYPGAAAFLQEGKAAIIAAAVADTAALLRERFGDADPTAYNWGDLHVTNLRGAWPGMEGRQVVSDGSDGTVNVSGAALFDGDAVLAQHASTSGAIYRMVTSFGEDGTPQAAFNYPPGNSGDPASPHFADTLSDWVDGNYGPLMFERSAIEPSATAIATLK